MRNKPAIRNGLFAVLLVLGVVAEACAESGQAALNLTVPPEPAGSLIKSAPPMASASGTAYRKNGGEGERRPDPCAQLRAERSAIAMGSPKEPSTGTWQVEAGNRLQQLDWDLQRQGCWTSSDAVQSLESSPR